MWCLMVVHFLAQSRVIDILWIFFNEGGLKGLDFIMYHLKCNIL